MVYFELLNFDEKQKSMRSESRNTSFPGARCAAEACNSSIIAHEFAGKFANIQSEPEVLGQPTRFLKQRTIGVLQESLLAATLTAANIERVSRACGVAASWPTFFAAALERFSSALPSCMGKVAASSCKMF